MDMNINMKDSKNNLPLITEGIHSANDINEPWPCDGLDCDKFGDASKYFIRKIKISVFDESVPLGFIANKEDLDKFESCLRVNLELLEHP
jgi:hypothetical protein